MKKIKSTEVQIDGKAPGGERKRGSGVRARQTDLHTDSVVFDDRQYGLRNPTISSILSSMPCAQEATVVTEMCNGVQMLWCTYRQDPSLTPDLLTNSKKAELIKASSPSPVAMKATTSGYTGQDANSLVKPNGYR